MAGRASEILSRPVVELMLAADGVGEGLGTRELSGHLLACPLHEVIGLDRVDAEGVQ